MEYFKLIPAKWSDMDPNGHLKNTAYSEFCTFTRFSFFAEHGFGVKRLKELEIGPIIIREESRFFREVDLLETVKVTCRLYQASVDFAKFNFRQTVFKENGKKAAQLSIDALWLNLKTRKAITPPPEVAAVCEKIPKTEDFEVITEVNWRKLIRNSE